MEIAESEAVDALVVGGGPAGLAAGLWLARHRFKTLVVDRGEPRNRWVEASFGYLGFDGQAPEALLAAGRDHLAGYPEAELVEARVEAIEAVDGAFVADLDRPPPGDGGHRRRRVTARALVLATGVADRVPPLEGLRPLYGKCVFVCHLCDGYEVKDQEVAVLGAAGNAGAFATELLRWASRVIVVPLGGEGPTDTIPERAQMASAAASAVVGSDGVLDHIALADGSRVECDAIFLRSETVAVTHLARQLGCALDSDGLVMVDAEGATTVERVYSAGDATPGPQIVQVAAAEGARAGLACAQALMVGREGAGVRYVSWSEG
ncbi:MAG: NAD(P)/FAD-dependent oxidoreductase [Acidimicrobiales bacterium]